MSRQVATVVCVCSALLVTACAGGGAEPGPNAPTVGAGVGSNMADVGPLAVLDPKQAKQESWHLDHGPAPFLTWEAQHLRISASCRQPSGQMDCEALRFVRRGPSVELTPQERARMASPGATICMKLKNQLTTGRDPQGNEDGFCIFPDGSMIATGSLEYHALK